MDIKEESSRHDVIVEKIIHRNPENGFSVFEVVEEDSQRRWVAAGVVPMDITGGEALSLLGRFEEHPRFGLRFRIVSSEPRLPFSTEGIKRYLASGRIPGIGPKLAERLVAFFGSETMRVLEEEPERIREVPGVGPRKAAEVERTFARDREERRALVFLRGLGIGPALAAEIWKALGTETTARVRSNPYALSEVVSGIGFLTADRIARALGLSLDAEARVRAAFRHILRSALEQGHTCLARGELIQRAATLLELPPSRLLTSLAEEVREERLKAVVPDLPAFVDPGDSRIYLPIMLQAEEEAAERLLRLAATSPPPSPLGRDPVIRDGDIQLTDEQREALRLLLSAKVGILSGGPGVGKTTVLKALVSAYRGAGFQVALASPTGRAARRLQEATGYEAHTLHKLFGFVPGVFRSQSPGPLEADVLIIDEASMLDLPLLLRILRKLRDPTILIFVGDPQQLPSVGPGRVLSDLLESLRFPTARLERIFRQESGGWIVENAHRILKGSMPLFPSGEVESDFYFMERPDPRTGAALVEELFTTRLPRHYGYDPHTDIQVLTPMHRGPAGVTALNERLQTALTRGRPEVVRGERVFRPGDRIMQTSNDYEADLMNGDLGTILRVDPERQEVLADFDGREIVISGAALDAVSVAYAMTVHKAQGGEFPVVILPLFSDHMLMLRRNVVYTAVTRARRLLVIIGTEKALRTAVRDDRMQRRQGEFLSLLKGHPLVPVPIPTGGA